MSIFAYGQRVGPGQQGRLPFSENDVAPFAPKSICTLWRVILCVALVIVVAVWAFGRGGVGAIRGSGFVIA